MITTRLLSETHKVVREYQMTNGSKPIELRMTLNTAKAIAEESGLIVEDRDVAEGARIFDILISIDSTLEFGEVIAWPTPDERVWTQIVAKQRSKGRP